MHKISTAKLSYIVSLKQLNILCILEMSPQWVAGLAIVIGQCPYSRSDRASPESLCSTTGATQNSQGCHLVSIRWSHNTLCMHSLHVLLCVYSMCRRIHVFLCVFSPLTTDGRPAPDLCFKKVNEAGDMYGNCGKDLFGKYRSCKDR